MPVTPEEWKAWVTDEDESDELHERVLREMDDPNSELSQYVDWWQRRASEGKPNWAALIKAAVALDMEDSSNW